MTDPIETLRGMRTAHDPLLCRICEAIDRGAFHPDESARLHQEAAEQRAAEKEGKSC
jgi:hypothetical protein